MVHPFGGNTCISVFYSIPRSVNLVVTGAGVSPKVQQLKKNQIFIGTLVPLRSKESTVAPV